MSPSSESVERVGWMDDGEGEWAEGGDLLTEGSKGEAVWRSWSVLEGRVGVGERQWSV